MTDGPFLSSCLQDGMYKCQLAFPSVPESAAGGVHEEREAQWEQGLDCSLPGQAHGSAAEGGESKACVILSWEGEGITNALTE